MRSIAIIPARGGSKRIPKKNIKDFNGKPLISYSIKTAIESKLFDSVIVSTDSDEIKAIADSYGASTPFKRSKDLSNDYANIGEVMIDAIKKLSHEDSNIIITCIYATAVLLTSNDLIEGMEIFKKDSSKFVIAATNFPYPVQRGFRLDKNLSPIMDNENNFFKRSQDLESYFHDAGLFTIASQESWLQDPKPFGKDHRVVKIPSWRVQDIDTEDDWDRAQLIHKLIQYNDVI